VLRNFAIMRETAGMTPEILLRALAQAIDNFAARPPSAAPWSLGVCKAIREAAPRKLRDLAWRTGLGRPVRGIVRDDITALTAHGDALAGAFGGDDAEFAARIAYANAFTFSHHLSFGEVYNRNDPTPLWSLYQATEAQDLGPGERQALVPLAWLRDGGVIYGLGLEPTASLAERWTPGGILFVPTSGRSLRLDDFGDLALFLAQAALPITGETLAALIWAIAAPLPFDATLTAAPDLDAFATEEAEIEDHKLSGARVSTLLGVPSTRAPKELPELVLTFEPGAITARYVRGELSWQ
jgi:hypothetical protein